MGEQIQATFLEEALILYHTQILKISYMLSCFDLNLNSRFYEVLMIGKQCTKWQSMYKNHVLSKFPKGGEAGNTSEQLLREPGPSDKNQKTVSPT